MRPDILVMCAATGLLLPVGHTEATELGQQSGIAQEAARNACAAAAFTDYIYEDLALSGSPGAHPLKSVGTIVAQRRLQEEFCTRFVRCTVGEPTSTSIELDIRAAFSLCLRDEALVE